MAGGLLKALSLMGAIQAAGSAVLFPIVLLTWARRSPIATKHWAILRRGNRHVALAENGHPFSTGLGFAFAVFFYWGFPIWWWLWGFKRTLALLLTPVVAAIAIGQSLVALDVAEDSMLPSSVLAVVGRVAAAFYVRRKHNWLRRSAYEARGWTLLSTIEAATSSDALLTVLPAQTESNRLRRLFSKLRPQRA